MKRDRRGKEGDKGAREVGKLRRKRKEVGEAEIMALSRRGAVNLWKIWK